MIYIFLIEEDSFYHESERQTQESKDRLFRSERIVGYI